ncbi:type II secretion system protein GspM [Sphingomicrobium marinum]|uniref:type II secretion system protein GspM n=1 Tax=Sphingomicrobium marinum TaxID=1227950 RepID=UPI00223F8138|nr:type II secretion system protein GspM [Sphingomicrobium marinum]
MKEWWFSRTPRERLMLMVMMAVAIPVLGWLLVVTPLLDAKEEARADYLLALDRHVRVEALANPAPATGEGIAVSLIDYLDTQASQRGFSLTVNALEAPGQARIAIAQANGQALLGWLSELEAVGLVLNNVQITPGEAGGVSMSATIMEPTP